MIDAMAPRRSRCGRRPSAQQLIQNGGLKLASLAAVVDKHLIRYASDAHGVRLTAVDLAKSNPMSSSSCRAASPKRSAKKHNARAR
jgi:hypothetical protein